MTAARSLVAGLGLALVLSLPACQQAPSGDGDEPEAGGHAGSVGEGGRAGDPGAGGAAGGAGQAGRGGATEERGGGSPSGGMGGGGVGGMADDEGGGGAQGGVPPVPTTGGTAGTATGDDAPAPALTTQEEEAAVAFWKSKLEIVAGKREEGHIVELALWEPIGGDAPPSRLRDADLARILGFNKLRRLEIHHPNITKEGAQVIRRLPSLEYLGFQYTAKTNGSLDPDFMLVATAHRDRLVALSYKHLFSQKGTAVHKLGTFPKLRYVVLDNQSAQSEAVVFLKVNPSIVGLELHRTSINGAQLKEIADALPNLKCLHLKKAGGSLSGADVTNAFRDHPALEVFWPHGISASIPGVKTVSGDESGVFSKPCGGLRPVDKPGNRL